MTHTPEELAGLIGRRAENLFETHQLFCSEAVVCVLNQGLAGGLAPETAIRLASGFAEGIGEAGCACGALSGAVMALGLFVGQQGSSTRGRKKIQAAAKQLHDLFKSKFGSACCRVLTQNVRDDSAALFAHCVSCTGETAEMAARVILERRPGLVEQADWNFLTTRDSKLVAGINRLLAMRS